MKAFRQTDLRNGQATQTEGALTPLAEEMRVQICQTCVDVLTAMTTVRAGGVFHLSAAIIHSMHQVVTQKQRERTKHRAFVNGAQPSLDVRQRQRALGLTKHTQYKQAHCRRADTALKESMFNVCSRFHVAKLMIYAATSIPPWLQSPGFRFFSAKQSPVFAFYLYICR